MLSFLSPFFPSRLPPPTFLQKNETHPFLVLRCRKSARETVSAVFGSKRALLAELINPDAFGPHFQHLLDQLRATPEPSRRLSLVAQMTCQGYEPVVPELELLRTAGAVAPELADLAQQVESRRRQNHARLVGYLHEQQVLRHGLPLEEATDLLWALTGYDLYRMLVVERR